MAPNNENMSENTDLPSGIPKPFKTQDDAGPCTSRLQKFEDLLEIIGPWGRWNVTILVLGCCCTFTNSLQLVSYQFLGATPNYWCQVDTLREADWTTEEILSLAIPMKNKINISEHEGCIMYDYDYKRAAGLGYEAAMNNLPLITKGDPEAAIPCSSREFNSTQYLSTVVTEWDLVCERRALYSTTSAVTHIGTLLGYLIMGPLLDQFGRRRIVLASVFLSLLSGFGSALSTSFEMYVVLKTVVSIYIVGYYLGCFVIIMELGTPSQRSSVGSMFVIPWALGFMTVPGIAYLVREWRWLQAAYTVPILALLIYIWILPESPRWLIQKERYEEAINIFQRAARINRKILPPTESLLATMKNIRLQEKSPEGAITSMSAADKAKEALKNVAALLTNPRMRLNTTILIIDWFAGGMVYYGLSLNSNNLSADPYLYVCLGGAVEVPSYFLLWLAISYLGRKTTLVALYVISAICIAVIAVIIYLELGIPVAVVVMFSLIGKMAMTAAFHLLFVFTAELYPTKHRSMALSLLSLISRSGSSLSPYINDILGEVKSFGPSALFAFISILAGMLSLLLPETRDSRLVEGDEVIGRTEENRMEILNTGGNDNRRNLNNNKCHDNKVFEAV